MATEHAAATALIREGIESMPLNALLGVRLIHMEGGQARAVLPFRRELANHVGTVHTAAQFALAEAASAGAISSAFVDLVGEAVPLALGGEVSYARAVTGDLVAVAAIPADAAERARQGLAADGHVRLAVSVVVSDASGQPATEARMRWVLRRTATPAEPQG